MSESKILVEKWEKLIDSPKARAVKSRENMARILESQEQYLQEAATTLGDVAQYTPILVPAVRRIVPNLLANEIVDVQPMNGPTGYAFALRFGYAGAGGKKTLSQDHNYPNLTRSVQKNSQAFLGFAVVTSTPSAAAVGDTVKTSSGTLVGTIIHKEGTKILVDLATTATHYFDKGVIYTNAGTAVQTVVGTDTLQFNNVASTINVAFNNEAGYNLIFSNYIPSLATGAAEYLTRANMKTMKMSVERMAVEAQTRKLKAEYSIELAQDLKTVHGMDAEAELINILEYEIAAELDRELVEAIYANTTDGGTWSYGSVGVYEGGVAPASGFVGVADGRWEMEKFRTLYTRIIREANAVAISTRRGAANFIICSLNVATVLQTLQNFMYAAVPGSVETTIGVAKIGTLDGRFTVYLDTFAFDDFFVVGYKGGKMDSGLIYCPYVPLMIQKVTDPDTMQPLIGMQTRDAIIGNMWGAEKYYRKVSCNFAGSSLINGLYYGSW